MSTFLLDGVGSHFADVIAAIAPAVDLGAIIGGSLIALFKLIFQD